MSLRRANGETDPGFIPKNCFKYSALAKDKFFGSKNTDNTEAENTGTNADELEIPQKAITQGDQAQSGTQRRQGRGRYKPPTGGNASQNGAISGDRPTKAGGSGAGGGKISKFNQSGSASRGKSPTKSIPNRSVTGGKEGELLDFIASKESGGAGGYAAVYGVGATDMQFKQNRMIEILTGKAVECRRDPAKTLAAETKSLVAFS